jgi:hypothetical protein
VIHARGMLRDFPAESVNTREIQLSERRATSQVHGSCYPARKTIRQLFYKITTVKRRLT